MPSQGVGEVRERGAWRSRDASGHPGHRVVSRPVAKPRTGEAQPRGSGAEQEHRVVPTAGEVGGAGAPAPAASGGACGGPEEQVHAYVGNGILRDFDVREGVPVRAGEHNPHVPGRGLDGVQDDVFVIVLREVDGAPIHGTHHALQRVDGEEPLHGVDQMHLLTRERDEDRDERRQGRVRNEHVAALEGLRTGPGSPKAQQVTVFDLELEVGVREEFHPRDIAESRVATGLDVAHPRRENLDLHPSHLCGQRGDNARYLRGG